MTGPGKAASKNAYEGVFMLQCKYFSNFHGKCHPYHLFVELVHMNPIAHPGNTQAVTI